MDVSDMDPMFAMIAEARFKEYGLIKPGRYFRELVYKRQLSATKKMLNDDRDTILIDEPPISVGFIVEYINLLMSSADVARM
jgi:hypothetical protein